MWKQIQLLAKLKLCNIGGLNQIRYNKDPKEKNKLIMMACVYVFIGIMIIGYSAGLAYSFIMLGIPDMVPPYMMTIISLIILFLSIYKTGSLIFEMRTYEMLISLPLSPAAIIVSRVCTMYLQNILFSAAILIPSAAVCGVFTRPAGIYYIGIAAGIFLIPLLPMAIAIAAGAAITAVSSRMKHKNLTTIVLSMVLTLGFLAVSMTAASKGDMFTNDLLRSLASIIEKKLYGIYPPARLFAQGVTQGSLISYILFILLSVIPFLILFYIIQKNFVSICMALNSKTAKKDYELKSLKAESAFYAVYIKDLSCYFSSSLYVMNTLIGYLMMILAAAGILITGIDKIDQMIGIPGLVMKLLPFIFAITCSMMPTTTSSISIEGKNWWLMQSLPISSRQLFNSKILVNLTIALPCYAVTQLLMLGVSPLPSAERLAVLFIPLAYIVMSSVLGITVNRKMPLFHWDNDAAVVKSSGAVAVTLLLSFASVILPGLMLLIPHLSYYIITAVTVAAAAAVTFFCYRSNLKVNTADIGE